MGKTNSNCEHVWIRLDTIPAYDICEKCGSVDREPTESCDRSESPYIGCHVHSNKPL